MRRVTCVSPHGGAHHGTDRDGDPVGPGYSGPMAHPPNPGGYVDSPVLGRVAVGSEVDAPDAPEFICDGFHFVNEDGGADECKQLGRDCWCGRHRDVSPVPVVGGGGEYASEAKMAVTVAVPTTSGGAGRVEL